MTTGNENSPLTRSASGQKNGTAIDARGLSSADNGMTAENIRQRKSPAPELASEAADQRPSTENSTAVGIVDAQAASGNGTSSKVGRADALTRESIEAIARKYAGAYFSGLLFQDADSFARFSDDLILAASPLEQPAAAPNDSGTVSVACFSGSYPHGTITYSQLAPSPADERAAFPRYAEWLHLRTHGEWSSGVPEWARDHSGRMNDFTAASAVIEELAAARAASATETVTEGATCRTCSGRGMIGGPSYYAPDEGGEPCPDCAAPQPAQAATPVLTNAMRAVITNESGAYQSADDLYAALCAAAGDERPAQADARVGMTDEQREAMHEVIRAAGGYTRGLLDAMFFAAHPGQPEPRAKVTDDDKEDAARWRHFYGGHYIICKVHTDGTVKNLGGGYVAKYAIDAARTGASS
ncbi:hypothetical protein [Burkholderia sp. 572]|uniref:hypothetical protein n=1 Tax=Burkholderia sp. 572 TaxID=3156414 RepID=UPI00339B0DC0